MRAAVFSSWTLFLGMAFMMLGGGLQGSLLGVRSAMEGFSTGLIGFIMAGYFLGFVFGSRIVPVLIVSVGHIRVFAALASTASASALVHALITDPFVWMGARFVTGVCFSGLYIVAESWLNARSTNETRGQLLSIYAIVQISFMALGQYLLNVSDPGGFTLFILVSILVSFALVPMALTSTATPPFEVPEAVSIPKLFRISPLGTVTAFVIGIAQATYNGMGAVYATQIGLSLHDVANFMAASLIGQVLLQWPIGRISDRIDRRIVIVVTSLIGGLFAFGLMVSDIDKIALFAIAAVFGALTFPLYAVALAHINDHLEPRQMLGASATTILTYGLGTIAGPAVVGVLMGEFGTNVFAQVLGITHLALALYGVYRMFRRDAIPVEDRGDYVSVSPRTSVVSTVVAPQTALDEEDQEIDLVFEPQDENEDEAVST